MSSKGGADQYNAPDSRAALTVNRVNIVRTIECVVEHLPNTRRGCASRKLLQSPLYRLQGLVDGLITARLDRKLVAVSILKPFGPTQA